MNAQILVCALALAFTVGADAQAPADATQSSTPAKDPVFSVDVPLVNVAFSVRDAAGGLVSGLSKTDIEVYEDGVRQEIRNFSHDQDTALSLGLALDRSGSQSDLEADNFQTAVAFLHRILRPQDNALLVGFGNRIKLLHEFTSNSRELEMAILDANHIYDGVPRVGPQVERSGGTAVNDAVFWIVHEKFFYLPGRKALVMIGDGEENSSKFRVSTSIEELQRADVLFYGLNNGGNAGQRKRHPNVMPYLAEGSGGREFRVGSGSLKEAFDQIEAELRGLYSVGYISSRPGKAGEFRKIEIRASDKKLSVRNRPGYYVR
jgi:Ca-activated chloride channel family protein